MEPPSSPGPGGSLIRTGKNPGGKDRLPRPLGLRRPITPPLAPRLPGDGFLLLALLLYAPVGFCLLVLHACFLGSGLPGQLRATRQCLSQVPTRALGRAGAGPGPRPGSHHCVRRFINLPGPCVQCWGSWRQEDSGLRDHRVRVLISDHVTPFDPNIVNLLTSCSTVS